MHIQVERIIKHPATIPVAIGVVSASVGIATGYYVGFHRGFNHAVDIMKEEEAAYLAAQQEPEGYAPDPEALEELRKKMEKDGYVPPLDEVVVSERVLGPAEVAKMQVLEVSMHSDGNGIPGTSIELVESMPEPEYSQELLDAAARANISPAMLLEGIAKVRAATEREAVDFGTIEGDEEVITPPEIEVNIFTNDTPGWDQGAEEAGRANKAVYVIHRDEWDEGEYNQVTLTWFEGDQLMAEGEVDDEMSLIPNPDQIIGDGRHFGHGSKDPNVYYVRNDNLEVDYMILRDSGHYAVTVMGLDPDEVGERTRPRRMRRESAET